MGVLWSVGTPFFLRVATMAELYYWGAFLAGILLAFAFVWWVRP